MSYAFYLGTCGKPGKDNENKALEEPNNGDFCTYEEGEFANPNICNTFRC